MPVESIDFGMPSKYGFTLIELLVVMGIMSVLATITFGQYGSAQKKARDVQRKNDISAVMKALNFFYNDYKKIYSVYDPSPGAPLTPMNTLLSTGGLPLTGPGSDFYVYMAKVPKDSKAAVVGGGGDTPTFIKHYCYVADVGGSSFAIFANLENRNDKDCKDYTLENSYVAQCNGGIYFNYAVASPNVAPEFFTEGYSIGMTAPLCN